MHMITTLSARSAVVKQGGASAEALRVDWWVDVQGGVQGAVRSWVEWADAGLLLLNMKHNRWCANVGRAHRSNGIFYVVSLQVPFCCLPW